MNIGKDYADGRLTLYLEGELDHHSARPAMKAIEQAMEETLPRLCVLDMAGLSFMDSSGIAIALHTLQQMKQLGGKMRIANSPVQVKKVFAAAGIQKMIGMEDVT